MLQCLTPYQGGLVTFKGNQKGKITRVGKIDIHHYPSIDDVLFVEGLKQNLLSISQLCKSGYAINKDEFILYK